MSDIPIRNRILAALPKRELKRICSKLEPIPLIYKETILRPGDPVQHAYFPEIGVISLLSSTGRSSGLEIGVVGSEGMLGLPLYLGAKVSRNIALVQGGGSALRMTAQDFLAECDGPGQLRTRLKKFTNAFIAQVSQSAVCFRFHPAEKRLARWLLMMADRMESAEFPITQEFLSSMLGVRREAVNKHAGELQKRGLITYSRGRLKVVNRPRLERASCDCYRLIRSEEIALGE